MGRIYLYFETCGYGLQWLCIYFETRGSLGAFFVCGNSEVRKKELGKTMYKRNTHHCMWNGTVLIKCWMKLLSLQRECCFTCTVKANSPMCFLDVSRKKRKDTTFLLTQHWGKVSMRRKICVVVIEYFNLSNERYM